MNEEKANARPLDGVRVLELGTTIAGPFCGRLLGDFALALWDGRRRRILVARDALGARTLYYHVSTRRLALASEARALLAG